MLKPLCRKRKRTRNRRKSVKTAAVILVGARTVEVQSPCDSVRPRGAAEGCGRGFSAHRKTEGQESPSFSLAYTVKARRFSRLHAKTGTEGETPQNVFRKGRPLPTATGLRALLGPS